MKKVLLGLAFSILPIIAIAQQVIYIEGEPHKKYDGISYAFLVEKNVAKEDYPKDETEFLLIKDSFQ